MDNFPKNANTIGTAEDLEVFIHRSGLFTSESLMASDSLIKYLEYLLKRKNKIKNDILKHECISNLDQLTNEKASRYWELIMYDSAYKGPFQSRDTTKTPEIK